MGANAYQMAIIVCSRRANDRVCQKNLSPTMGKNREPLLKKKENKSKRYKTQYAVICPGCSGSGWDKTCVCKLCRGNKFVNV